MISVGFSVADPELRIADIRIVEGNSGQTSVDVLVILSQVAPSQITVEYVTRDGTAQDGSDYNTANGIVTFTPGDRTQMISVAINGDLLIEADEMFEILLTNPSGATIYDDIGNVMIVNDDFRSLGPEAPIVYEIQFTFTGYLSFFGNTSDCPTRSNGKVILTGLMSGSKDLEPDDDMSYTGNLQLDIDIDICSTKQGLNGVDEFCSMTVMGSGIVKAELEIYYDQRGGYINIEDENNEFIKLVFGSCNKNEMYDEQDMVPNKSIASVFNGIDLLMLTDRTLQVGRYVERVDGSEMIVEVLRVIKK
jgi:hypothetical protein